METAIYMLGLAIYTLVFVMVRTYEEADPKRYSRSVAQFFVAATTAYIILSLFTKSQNTFCYDKDDENK